MEYCLAAALTYGQVTFDEFTDAKVTTRASPCCTTRSLHPSRVRTPDSVPRDFTDLVITHKDGRRFHDRSTKAKGYRAKRWSLDEFKGKFVRCAAAAYGEAEAGRRWDRTYHLADCDARDVASLFTPAR